MFISKKSIARRTFLKGAGAASIGLPFLEAMVPALAGPADLSKKPVVRMGFVYVPNGVLMDKWMPSGEGMNYQMSPSLRALSSYRDRFLVLSGLDQNPANALPGEGGAFHTRTTVAYLTGVHPKPTKGADIHAGISVDQIAAKEFGSKTQLASLEMSLDSGVSGGVCEGEYTCAYFNTLCWRTPTTPLPMEHEPRAIFERLFGDSDTTDPAARLIRIRENRSILDSVCEEVGRLQGRLHSKDRAKLDEYLDAIRDVERRIQLAEEQSSREIPTMQKPVGEPALFEDYAKLMFDLQILAFQTDMTRVITFRMGCERSGRTYGEIGVPDSHHAVSHHRGDPALMAKVALINAFHVKLFAYYLDKLRSTPDGDGSLLDHSMIVYGGGMSDGNMHTNQNLPVVLAGGAAGKFKGGSHVRYPKGTPMTNLYLTMLDAMSVPIERLGDSNGELRLLDV